MCLQKNDAAAAIQNNNKNREKILCKFQFLKEIFEQENLRKQHVVEVQETDRSSD